MSTTTEKPAEKFDLVDWIMEWESGNEMGQDRLVEGFQYIVDQRLYTQLQGAYGRAASGLIQQGLVHDTYGDFTGMPSKD